MSKTEMNDANDGYLIYLVPSLWSPARAFAEMLR